MAAKRVKRRNSHFIKPEQAAGVLVGFGILAVIANNASAISSFLVVVVGVAIAAWFFNRLRRRIQDQNLLQNVADAIEKHENALISYYHQSRREDLFGNRDESRWHERVDVFLRTQAVPNLSNFAAWRASAIGQRAAALVCEATARTIATQKEVNPLAHVDADSLTPLEYERHCGDLLKAQGWSVQQTQATRDGGADFVAEKGKLRLVVQCKRYSQPVGNKAVQEVTAAVRLYNGNVACVVAPTGFTRQAQQEAAGLSVHLLHHSALPAFAEKLAA